MPAPAQEAQRRIAGVVEDLLPRLAEVLQPSASPETASVQGLLHHVRTFDLSGKSLDGGVAVEIAGQPTEKTGPTLRVPARVEPALVAVGLGVSAVLQALGENVGGTVRTVFVLDSEDDFPEDLVADGDPVYDIRPEPELKSGVVSIFLRTAKQFSSRFAVTLSAPGGDAAARGLRVDVVEASAQLIAALNQMPSRKLDPTGSAQLAVEEVRSHGGAGSPATRAELQGLFRALEEEAWRRGLVFIRQTVAAVSGAYGAEYDLAVREASSAVLNDAEEANILWEAGRAMLGVEGVVPRTAPPAYLNAGTRGRLSALYVGLHGSDHRSAVAAAVKALSWACVCRLAEGA